MDRHEYINHNNKKLNDINLKYTNLEREEQDKIYNYFKEHPSLLISIMSAIVVVVGFIFNSLIYVNECRYLEYWHLDKSIINIKNENQIYEIVTICLLFLGIVVVQMLIISSLDKYFDELKVYRYAKIIYWKQKKESKKIKKECKSIIKSAKKIRLTDENTKKIIYFEEKNNETQLIFKEFKRSAKKLYKSGSTKRNKKIILTIILSFILMFVFLFLFSILSGIDINLVGIALVGFITIIIMWLLAYLLLLFVSSLHLNLSFASMTFDMQMAEQFMACKNITQNPQYPVNKIFDLKIKNLLEKDRLVVGFISSMVCILLFIGMAYSINEKDIKENKTLAIIDYKETSYAIIYRDDKYFYLEEIVIEQNIARVYVNNQMRIAADELFSVNKEFEEVNLVLE